MLKPITLGALLLTFLAGFLQPASAIIWVPPMANQNIYPAPGGWVSRPVSTSNYSITNIPTAYGNVDLYLSAWSSPGNSEFVWRFATPGSDPGILANIIAQGTVPFSSITDLEVGYVNVGGGNHEIYLAYYRNGVGHRMDIYKLNAGLAAPAFSSTMILSASPAYGRIRIDCHKTYGVALVWQYPGVGIQTKVCNNGVWPAGVTTLCGTTANNFGPDVAFSHSSGPLNVHYVWQDQVTGDITESVGDWTTLLTGPAAYCATVEDVNPGVSTADLRPVIDCPDHFNVENWAYTYTPDNANIFVRFIDYNSGTPPTTVSVNSGALGNATTLGMYKVYSPCLYYGEAFTGGGTDHIHVGFYITDGSAFNGYVGIQMNEKGSALISAPDYMRLPAAFTATRYPLRPGVSYSRISDPGLSPNYMYATYYDLSGSYRLHHAAHPWGAVAFKGGQPVVLHPECGQQQSTTANRVAADITVSPNPFTDRVSTTFALQEAGIVRLQLMDITGRIVAQTSSVADQGTHRFSTDQLSSLPAGAYFLHISLNDKPVGQQKVIKQ